MALVLHLTTGEITFGVWCPRCNLSSGYEVPLYCMGDHGVSRVATFRKCHDCDQPILEEGSCA